MNRRTFLCRAYSHGIAKTQTLLSSSPSGGRRSGGAGRGIQKRVLCSSLTNPSHCQCGFVSKQKYDDVVINPVMVSAYPMKTRTGRSSVGSLSSTLTHSFGGVRVGRCSAKYSASHSAKLPVSGSVRLASTMRSSMVCLSIALAILYASLSGASSADHQHTSTLIWQSGSSGRYQQSFRYSNAE